MTRFFLLCLFSAAALASLPLSQLHLPRSLQPVSTSTRSLAEFLSQAGSLHNAPAVPVAPFAAHPLPMSWSAPQPLPLQPTPRLALAPSGAPSWIEFLLGTVRMLELPSPQGTGPRQRVPELNSLLTLLEQHRRLLRLEQPRRELQLLSLHGDELGMTHVRFQQLYEGIPVWGADLYVHLLPTGELSLLNGRYFPTPAGAPTKPQLTASDAQQRALAYLQQMTTVEQLPEELFRLTGTSPLSAQLVLFPHPLSGALFLCYEVHATTSLTAEYVLFIDAFDGTLRWHFRNSRSFRPEPSLPHYGPLRRLLAATPSQPLPSAMPGSFVDASGTDANGVQQRFRVYRHDDGRYYMIWDLPSYNASASQPPNRITGGAVTLTANYSDFDPQNPRVYHITSPNNVWNDPIAISAHVNASVAYTYYRTTHNRNAIDGQGGTIYSIVHVTENGQPMINAFWHGGLKIMAYGDGDGYRYKPFAAALDVVAHEMTHGVTQHTANLVYQFQSGALNESFSDVFGIMVDRDDFLIGEDLVGPGSTYIATRDLLNPSNPRVETPQPAHMSQYVNWPIDRDNGGVHINSGIPNRAAALLIQQIGREKVERIYYRALSSYLTRTSEFVDCRRAILRSARELYGTAEEQAAAQAFDAVGITDTGSGGGTGNEVPPVQGGTWYITFALSDGSIALLNTATGQGGIISSNDPRTKVLVANGYPLSQLSTARSGDRIYFVNQQGQLAFADLAQGQFFIVTLPGLTNLRNACISSDGRIAAILLQRAEPFLYLTDGQNTVGLELIPEVPDGGKVRSIQFADVMSWTPNMKDPRLAFDAFNVLPLQSGDTLAYWNIYEIRFAGPAIYELVPPNPQGYSLGNITYSNTDPDLIAFNYYDHTTGLFETILANLQTGQAVALGLSQYFADAQRPTFSPDSRFLALVSPSQGALIVVDLQQGQFSSGSAGQPIYHPRWFAQGATGIAMTSPQSGALRLRTSPEGLCLGYWLSEPAPVRIELVDAVGRRLLLRATEWDAAGYHERTFSLTLPSGWYLLQLWKGTERTSQPFLWLR